MKTLELKDICGYVPYGLKYLYEGNTIGDVRIQDYKTTIDSLLCLNFIIKPILRPMSDITEEITHEGERFVPIDVLNDRERFIEFDTAGLLYTVGGCMDSDWLMVFDKFHEWMFDYRGLISAGLAIDVNTLPENPYEQ